VLRAEGLDDEFEEGGFVCHLGDFTKLKGLPIVSMLNPRCGCYAAYCFKDTRSRLCMPSLNSTVELGARIKDTIVVVLVVNGSRYAVAKHALCETR
jgi:hypothetical protein